MEDSKQLNEDITETKSMKKGEEKKKFSKKMVVLITAVLALFAGFFLLLGIIIAIIVWPKKINLNDYITVEYSGYDTVGKATIVFDETAFMDKYGDKIKFKDAAYSQGAGFYEAFGATPADAFVDMVSVELSESSNLSNGQEITLSLNCSDEEFKEFFNYGIKFKEKTYKVEGLEEVAMFDPFENVDVSFYGVAPNGIVDIATNDSEGQYMGFGYQASEISGLSNGDTITVSLSCWGDPTIYCIENYGMCPTATEKEYVVEGLDRLAASLDEISEDAMDEMISQGEDVFNAYVTNHWDGDNAIDSISYVGAYYLTPKAGFESESYNQLYLVYKVNATWYHEFYSEGVSSEQVEFYYVVQFEVPIINTEGICTADITSYNLLSDSISITVYSDYSDREYSLLSTIGFEDINAVFKDCVESRIDTYNYESSISL